MCALLVWRRDGLSSARAWRRRCRDAHESRAEVRSAFDRMARRLRTMAVQTSDLPTIRAALDGDTSAVRRLLTSTAAVISEDAPFDPALTIYAMTESRWRGRDVPAICHRIVYRAKRRGSSPRVRRACA